MKLAILLLTLLLVYPAFVLAATVGGSCSCEEVSSHDEEYGGIERSCELECDCNPGYRWPNTDCELRQNKCVPTSSGEGLNCICEPFCDWSAADDCTATMWGRCGEKCVRETEGLSCKEGAGTCHSGQCIPRGWNTQGNPQEVKLVNSPVYNGKSALKLQFANSNKWSGMVSDLVPLESDTTYILSARMAISENFVGKFELHRQAFPTAGDVEKNGKKSWHHYTIIDGDYYLTESDKKNIWIKKWVKFKTDSSTRLGKIFLISTTDSFTGTVYVDDVRLEKVDDSPVFSLRPDCNLCGCPGGSSCSRTGECVANEVASLSDDLAFKILAIDAKYKPFCDEISSESMRDLCVDDLAVSTKDFLACDDIASPAKKSFCKNRIFTFLEKRSPVCGDTIVEGGEECESDSDCSHISSGVCGECVCYKSVEISFSGLKSTRSAKMDANIFANIDAGDLTNGIYVVKPVEVVYEEDLSTLKYQGKPLLGPYELVSAVADPYYHTFSCFETKCEGLCNLFGATKIMDFLAKGSMAIAKGVLWWLPTHFDDCFKKGEQSEGACDLDVKDKDGNLKAGWEFLSRKKDVNFKCNVMGTWFRSLTSGKVPQCKYADRLSTEIRQSSCYSIINGNNLVLSFPTYYAFQNSQGQNLGSSKTYWPKKPEEYKFSYTVRGMVVP